ncbi:sigma-70 region 4 domain-containing protein [Microvirga massiliensis]|uniref:sigma-70 region 4 domain-containing protein n=1 Tax=Microvirga massiliensis TaxID=1033741 RepID=UPI00062BB5D2|nr:sigma-70 region 4 domain-containing protein [Microvirga massiliensis]
MPTPPLRPAPWHSKTEPVFRLNELAADYRRHRDLHLLSGGMHSPPIPRQLLEAADQAQLSCRQIATLLDLSVSTVRAALIRAGYQPRTTEPASVVELAVPTDDECAPEEMIADDASAPPDAERPDLEPGEADPRTASAAKTVADAIAASLKERGFLPSRAEVARSTKLSYETVRKHWEASLPDDVARRSAPADAYLTYLLEAAVARTSIMSGDDAHQITPSLIDAITTARVPASCAAQACGCHEADLIRAIGAAGGKVIMDDEAPGTCAQRLTPDGVRLLASLDLPITLAAEIAGVAPQTMRIRAKELGVSFVKGMAGGRSRPDMASEAASSATTDEALPTSDPGAIEVLARDLCRHAGHDPDERAAGVYGIDGAFRFDGVFDSPEGGFSTPWSFVWRAFAPRAAAAVQALEEAGFQVRR